MGFVGMIDVLDGFPVQIVTPLLGGTVTTTLRSIEQKELAPELFQVPEDYRPEMTMKASSMGIPASNGLFIFGLIAVERVVPILISKWKKPPDKEYD